MFVINPSSEAGSGALRDIERLTMTGDVVLTSASKDTLVLDPGGSARNLTMPGAPGVSDATVRYFENDGTVASPANVVILGAAASPITLIPGASIRLGWVPEDAAWRELPL